MVASSTTASLQIIMADSVSDVLLGTERSISWQTMLCRMHLWNIPVWDHNEEGLASHEHELGYIGRLTS